MKSYSTVFSCFVSFILIIILNLLSCTDTLYVFNRSRVLTVLTMIYRVVTNTQKE
jgi:hypothetical protein